VAGKQAGHLSLRDAAKKLVAAGVTDLREVERTLGTMETAP
jgi:hypothetical protein